MAEDEKSVRLVLPNREAWTLTANTPTVALEESVFLADERGPRGSFQIVLQGGLEEEREIADRVDDRADRGTRRGAPASIR